MFLTKLTQLWRRRWLSSGPSLTPVVANCLGLAWGAYLLCLVGPRVIGLTLAEFVPIAIGSISSAQGIFARQNSLLRDNSRS